MLYIKKKRGNIIKLRDHSYKITGAIGFFFICSYSKILTKKINIYYRFCIIYLCIFAEISFFGNTRDHIELINEDKPLL